MTSRTSAPVRPSLRFSATSSNPRSSSSSSGQLGRGLALGDRPPLELGVRAAGPAAGRRRSAVRRRAGGAAGSAPAAPPRAVGGRPAPGAATGGQLVGQAPLGDGGVARVEVVADVAAAVAGGGHERRARPEERVEDQVVLVGVEQDQPLGQLDRERRRVRHPAGALRRDLPHVERGGHELVGRDAAAVRPAGLALLDRQRPVEPALAGDDHPLGEVAQRGVGGLAERSPGAVPPAPAAFCQSTSPRSSRPSSSCRMAMTSADSDRYGLRPRLATLTAMRPPGSSTRLHSRNTSRSRSRYSVVRGRGCPRGTAPPRTACRRSRAAT